MLKYYEFFSLTLADFLRSVFITSINLSFFINLGKLEFSLFFCMLYRVTAYGVVTLWRCQDSPYVSSQWTGSSILTNNIFPRPRIPIFWFLKVHQNLLQSWNLRENIYWPKCMLHDFADLGAFLQLTITDLSKHRRYAIFWLICVSCIQFNMNLLIRQHWLQWGWGQMQI